MERIEHQIPKYPDIALSLVCQCGCQDCAIPSERYQGELVHTVYSRPTIGEAVASARADGWAITGDPDPPGDLGKPNPARWQDRFCTSREQSVRQMEELGWVVRCPDCTSKGHKTVAPWDVIHAGWHKRMLYPPDEV